MSFDNYCAPYNWKFHIIRTFCQVWDNLDPFEISTKHYLRPFLVIWTIFGNFGQKMTQMVNIFKNELHFWNQRKICYLVGGVSYQIRPQRKSRFFVWCPLLLPHVGNFSGNSRLGCVFSQVERSHSHLKCTQPQSGMNYRLEAVVSLN